MKSMMKTDPVFKKMYPKKFKTMDYVQNNSHIFSNKPLHETLRTYVRYGPSLLAVNTKTWQKYCWAEGCEWNDGRTRCIWFCLLLQAMLCVILKLRIHYFLLISMWSFNKTTIVLYTWTVFILISTYWSSFGQINFYIHNS